MRYQCNHMSYLEPSIPVLCVFVYMRERERDRQRDREIYSQGEAQKEGRLLHLARKYFFKMHNVSVVFSLVQTLQGYLTHVCWIQLFLLDSHQHIVFGEIQKTHRITSRNQESVGKRKKVRCDITTELKIFHKKYAWCHLKHYEVMALIITYIFHFISGLIMSAPERWSKRYRQWPSVPW